MTDYCSVYITAPDEKSADEIARMLVENRLAACANIVPGMRSVYRWEGKIETDYEIAIIAKTRKDLVGKLTAEVMLVHPYDCPCIVTWPIDGGHPAYLDWIGQETGGE
ncbi:MAG TPA: divalent-cation tolerance protein CutA [Alphaproteobacteria bacterium]|nr:divalent-cation tolerance protein CutA [Alphaproteobacteria bacterium]